MKHSVICPQCGVICEYDDHSIWEGNREQEEFICLECRYVLATVFTDQIPSVRLIKREAKKKDVE